MPYTGPDAAELQREARQRYAESRPERVKDSHREASRRRRERRRAEIRRTAPLDGRSCTNYVTQDLGAPPRRPCILCKVCRGMASARTPDRRDEHGRPILGPDGLCRGCGLPYAPDPEPRRDSGLRSSAAMALPWARQ